MTGVGPVVSPNSTGNPCQLYLVNVYSYCFTFLQSNPCNGGLWDRRHKICTESTSSNTIGGPITAEFEDRSTASTKQDTESVTIDIAEITAASAIIDSTINSNNNNDAENNITRTTPLLSPTTAHANTTPDVSTCLHCGCVNYATVGASSLVRFKFQTKQNKSLLCIMDPTNNLLWTVIQRRYSNGIQNFDMTWTDYESGFGSLTEFWIGNAYIHELTTDLGQNHLQIEIVTTTNEKITTDYAFHIDDVNNEYRLHVFDFVGLQGDPFTNSGSCTECANGMKFTTRDRDNDNDPNVNCASSSGGGWWHNACQRSNLNGRAGQTNYRHGLNWDGLTDISSVEMKVRKP
ncbi:angiopoietin-related protein 7-like [Crassostrea angulata]|uniref:angiopoietin-related protein 7-like n=1 Tax=Magallana angulata TaxID=2784310 RepID=UPI0022B211BE|nr:angiopoietin-related protein 7-like [Crassostrea angulata]